MRVHCPICGRPMPGAPQEWPQRPFCGERCRLIDLGRWLGGAYRIASPVPPDEGDADASKPAVPSADPHSDEAP